MIARRAWPRGTIECGEWRRVCRSRYDCRFRRTQLRVEGLEHTSGLLAARYAQIESLLFSQKDRVRIVLAIVTALAAILLPHGRHHPPPQRPAFSELHPLTEGQRLVVPGRSLVVAIIERASCRRRTGHLGHQGSGLVRGERAHSASEPEQPGEEAIEPS